MFADITTCLLIFRIDLMVVTIANVEEIGKTDFGLGDVHSRFFTQKLPVYSEPSILMMRTTDRCDMMLRLNKGVVFVYICTYECAHMITCHMCAHVCTHFIWVP